MSKKLMVVAALFASSTAATAQSQNYLAVAVGSAKHKQRCVDSTVCDSRSNAFRFFLGHPLSDSLWAEIGYLDWGKSRSATASQRITINASGVGGGLAIRYELPSKLVLGGRAGLMVMQARGTSTSSAQFFSGTDQSIKPYAGLIAGYRIHPSMTMDLSFDSTRIKFNRANVDASRSAYALTIGLTMEF